MAARVKHSRRAKPAKLKKGESVYCERCKVDVFEVGEYFMVRDEVWETALYTDELEWVLCVGCLEHHLGRTLEPDDFPQDIPINRLEGWAWLRMRPSVRLIRRMAGWA